MFVSGWKWKTRKIIHPPVPSYESSLSVQENTDRKRKKKTRKKQIVSKFSAEKSIKT